MTESAYAYECRCKCVTVLDSECEHECLCVITRVCASTGIREGASAGGERGPGGGGGINHPDDAN